MRKCSELNTITQDVYKLLELSDYPAGLTIEQCSSQLAMSMTSFRRKLTQEETTFKLIQSKFLNELCVGELLTDHIKIDDLAIKLGYSERSTFERAFRHKFGLTPSQFRDLSLVDNDKNNLKKFTTIAKNMPPLSESSQTLLRDKNKENFDIDRVISIVEKDPILLARLMGLASKAIYGKTPSTIQEAIGRNLGISAVVNIAVIFAVKDALQDKVDSNIINQYTDTLVMAPKLFHIVRKSLRSDVKFDVVLTEQILAFSLLGIFLLTHKEVHKHQLIGHYLQGIYDLQSFNIHVKKSIELSLYDASSLMLSLWSIDAPIIKKITHLGKVSIQKSIGDRADEVVLFMLSCLYVSAINKREYSELEEKAEVLNIGCFDEIKTLLFTAG